MSDIREYLEKAFVHHPPKPDQIPRYGDIRQKGFELAALIADCCPDSRERDEAFKKVEEAIMWANAGIARNE